MNRLVLEIENPEENGYTKFQQAVEALSKATNVHFHLDEESKAEPTPYRALREHAEELHQQVQSNLTRLFEEISRKWLHVSLTKAEADDTEPFRLNGKVYINPKTGTFLTRKEWKMVQDDLQRWFGYIYNDAQEAMVKQAIAMGMILNKMNPDERMDVPKADIGLDLLEDTVTNKQLYRNMFDFAQVHTGELIQDVTARSRRAIVDTIMNGYNDGITSRELRDRLFDKFSDLNRDWRRIAETESATNFNNGYLTAELENKRGDDDHQFMIGISGAGACSWCRTHVNSHVVVLLENAPGGGDDKVEIDGETYTAIWPGKNNFGRKRANWWVAAGSQHPHCRCTWSKYHPQFEAYERKLRDAMDG